MSCYISFTIVYHKNTKWLQNSWLMQHNSWHENYPQPDNVDFWYCDFKFEGKGLAAAHDTSPYNGEHFCYLKITWWMKIFWNWHEKSVVLVNVS
jgi:hypothetical protein